jgi:carbamoyl-phosphate synthase large subunit
MKPRRTASKPTLRRPSLRVLFTCVGRRVELLRAFRQAGEKLGIKLQIHGTDIDWLAPAIHLVDRPHIVPRIDSPKYIQSLLELAEAQRIDVLIPLIDSELVPLSTAAERFAEVGCRLLLSGEQVVRTCRDKIASYHALRDAGIDTPETWLWTDAITRKKHRFPYFLKPRHGSAGKGNYVIRNADELHTLGLRVPDAIVQEFVAGDEHTLDVYTGLDGVPRCAVPRKRIEVRTGEVSKGLIVKDPDVMRTGLRVAEVLGNCRGVITVQCIVTDRRAIRVIEINPRFGGGVPLSIHAGADFPRWILMEVLGRRPRINPTAFRDDIAMLRYDDSVFVPDASKRR